MLSEEATRAVIFTSGYATKALKEMDTRIQIFDMEEMISFVKCQFRGKMVRRF